LVFLPRSLNTSMLRLQGHGFKHYGSEWPDIEQEVEWHFQEATKTNGHPVRIEFVHSALTVTASLDQLQWIDELKEHYGVVVELSHTQDQTLPPNSLTPDYDVYLDRVIFWIANNPEWRDHAQVYKDMLNSLGDAPLPTHPIPNQDRFPELAHWFAQAYSAAER